MKKKLKNNLLQLGTEVNSNASLKRYNSLKLDVMSKSVIQVKSIEQLRNTIKLLQKHEEEYLVIGKGSNLLLTKRANNINFIVLKGDFEEFKVNENEIMVGPGYGIVPLSIMAAKKGLSGLEFSNGIPGSVGGAITMNAGAHGSDFSKIVDAVEVLDENNNLKLIKRKDLDFGYRKSIIQEKDWIVTKVILKMIRKESAKITEETKGHKEYRLSTQPLKKRTCGSVFKNPLPNHSAKLIEELGLKGFEFNGSKVSPKHANFIEAASEASSEDIIHIIKTIKRKVKQERDIDLELEVKKI